MPALKSLDDSIKPLAARNYSAAQKALRGATQRRAAELLGIAESTFSDWWTDHGERAMQVLAAIGAQAVPATEKTYPIRRVLAWRELARESFDHDDDITSPGVLGPAE